MKILSVGSQRKESKSSQKQSYKERRIDDNEPYSTNNPPRHQTLLEKLRENDIFKSKKKRKRSRKREEKGNIPK